MGIIRILLALAVLLMAHSTPILHIPMIDGAWAVQGFYVISGFYMALVLNEKYARGSRGYREFIGQRLLRLLPAYWVCVIGSIILGMTGWGTILPAAGQTPPYTYWQQHAGQLPGYQLFYVIFNQIFLFGQDWMLFMRLSPTGVLHFARDYHAWANPPSQFLFVAPAWSLGVELSFYLIAPFLVRQRWWILCIVIAISLAIRITMWRLLTHAGDPHTKYLNGDPWSYRFFPSEVGTFLMGALGYFFYAHAREKKINIRPFGWIAWAIILWAIFFLQPLKAHHVPPELFTVMMPFCIPFVFALTKNWKTDRWIGELSYPVYIAHVVVGAVIAKKIGAQAPGDVKGWMLMLWTLPIAILIRVCVEQPIDRWRQHLHNARHREPAAVISPAPM